MNIRTTLGRFVAATAASAVLAGAMIAGTAAQGTEQGRVRIMHASPDTPAVDIFVEGEKAVADLAFQEDTGYIALPAGAYNVKVFPAPSDGSGAPALEADLDVAAGKDYTILAVGQLGDGSLELLPLEDNNAAPAAGQAHIRLIHASPDAPAVDVGVAGTATNVFSNVAFKGVGAYTPVPAGTYDLEVKVAGTSDVAKAIPGLALQDGAVYTAVAVGLVSDGSLAVIPLLDAQAAQVTPTPQAPATGTGLSTNDNGMGAMTMAFIGLGVLATLGAGTALVAARRRA